MSTQDAKFWTGLSRLIQEQEAQERSGHTALRPPALADESHARECGVCPGRSVPRALLAGLAGMGGVSFFSLQKGQPWYPTMRIFRQPQPGAWEPVITKVRAALIETAQQSQQAQLMRVDEGGEL